jgi:hypothetical protein
MNFNTENSLPENRVLQQGNGEGLPFNQNDPNVYFMVSDSLDNILKAYINNIWGSTPSKSNLTSFSKVNVGDYIVTYCSVTGGEDKDKQGFHTIGIVTGKRDPEYMDKYTWDRTYGCIVDVKWINVPRRDRIFTLEMAQRLTDFSKWRFCLCNGQYTNVADKGWNIKLKPFNLLMDKLIEGIKIVPNRKLKIVDMDKFIDQWSYERPGSPFWSSYKVLHELENVVLNMEKMEMELLIPYSDTNSRWCIFKFVSVTGYKDHEVLSYEFIETIS